MREMGAAGGVDDDVSGVECAVDDADLMERLDAEHNFAEEGEKLGGSKGFGVRFERLAFDKFPDEEDGTAAGLVRIAFDAVEIGGGFEGEFADSGEALLDARVELAVEEAIGVEGFEEDFAAGIGKGDIAAGRG